jgi:LacI family transcriptional regulator
MRAGDSADYPAAASLVDRAGMRQVADRAGVAMSSVSRVLSGHPNVSTPMRDRVMAAVEELGYEPNMLAQMLRRGATQTIGFVVGDISNPLLAQITLGAEVALRAAGYAMLLTNSGDANMDATHIRLLQQRRVDGLLLSVSDETSKDTVEALRRTTTPCVLIDRELDLDEPASALLSDHAAGISQAVEHLVGLGHRRIALVAGSPHVRPTRERINALEETIERHPGVVAQVRSGAFTETHGAAATRELLLGRRPPTAIIAGGNQLMLGSLKVLHARGVRLGRDVSFVGCDQIPISELYEPPIAVVRRDTAAIGRSAADLMLALLGGDERVADVTLPSEFVARASCGPAPKG